MKLKDLIEALDNRYGNPYMAKEYTLIHEAIRHLQKLDDISTMPVKTYNGNKPHRVTKGDRDENCNGK